MLGYVAIVHIYFFLNLIFSFKARRGLQRQNFSLQNSAQCDTAQSPTWRSITLRRGRLRAVLDIFEFSDIWISWLSALWYCAESDSAQCDTARSLTRHSNTARSRIFHDFLCENKFFSETILDCLSGSQMGPIHEKKIAKNLVTLPL